MLSVILYEPEIPPNTGNIIRLCANTGAGLHLVEPLGHTSNPRIPDAKSIIDYIARYIELEFVEPRRSTGKTRRWACCQRHQNTRHRDLSDREQRCSECLR